MNDVHTFSQIVFFRKHGTLTKQRRDKLTAFNVIGLEYKPNRELQIYNLQVPVLKQNVMCSDYTHIRMNITFLLDSGTLFHAVLILCRQ